MLKRIYFCTWCGQKKSRDCFAPLENGWYDFVCLTCRSKEQQGLTMADVMAQ